MATGSSITLTMESGEDITTAGPTSVILLNGPTLRGAQPGAYVGSAPASVEVDGITLDWAGRPSVADGAGDTADVHVDLTQIAAEAGPSQVSILVSFASSPMHGEIVPVRLAPTTIATSTGGGGQRPPQVAPPNPGTDVLEVMIEADGDADTGYLLGGHGYDFEIRVEGKDGRVLPGGAQLLRWETIPSPGWSSLPQVPLVGIGATAIELGATNPPFVLVARNVTITAEATGWQGNRDGLEAPLIIVNSQGTRGEPIAAPPRDAGAEEPAQPPQALIPEFDTLFAPALAVLAIAGTRRHRRRMRLQQEEEPEDEIVARASAISHEGRLGTVTASQFPRGEGTRPATGILSADARLETKLSADGRGARR